LESSPASLEIPRAAVKAVACDETGVPRRSVLRNVRRLLPSLFVIALLLIAASACGSQAKTESAKRPEGTPHLLKLAVNQASSLGDSDPSLIGVTSSGRSASVVIGVHGRCEHGARLVKCGSANTSYLRFRVDSKTQKLSRLSPVGVPRVRGGTKAERALMIRIARSVGMSFQARIVIRKAGKSWHPHSPDAIVANFRGRTLEREWQAALAAVLFQHSADVPVVAFGSGSGASRIWGPTADSAPPTYEVGSPVSLPKELALARRLIATVDGDGARVVSLTLARPVGLTVSVTIQTDQPAGYLKHDLQAVLDIVRRPALAGSFVRVIDPKGERVLEAYAAPDEGGDWTLPSLAGCNPIMHLGGPFGSKQKPCPAK
jgi:hypothetical protein